MEAQAITATTWVIDPTHSEVQFKVKHLMVSTVTGSFGQYEGQLIMNGDDFEDAKINFSADISSISTNNEQRDTHLKSGEFFDADQFPQLTFASTGMKKTGDDTYELSGDLSLHGVTKPVILKAEYGGQMQDFHGQTKAGFEVTGVIKRKEYGLTWDGVTEAGGVVVSDDVRLIMNIQVTKQA
ncbi:YceI family protein [Spirosoma utsteinense]|uniref:Polyisoprenoid-binding protein YceI n=1 Tax=Spirosoma utsteinense TaxID=2585773 RepID=A0ABR6W1X3_9BACT|nr:YceI family protein [Spirosoma utsteinense]MBC3784519.1 polyisoprenoid-binding protein YceI [Spirosoma utsteinense]MBC3789730.1 polyisoprenoid-binding protein YceI [Spirosoma utsteinense]